MFGTLPIAAELIQPLDTAVAGAGWSVRETALATALEVLGTAQRDRDLPTPGTVVTPFFDRPYRTVDPAVVTLLRDGIADPDLLRLPLGVGSVEQWVDNVDVLAHRRVGVVEAYPPLGRGLIGHQGAVPHVAPGAAMCRHRWYASAASSGPGNRSAQPRRSMPSSASTASATGAVRSPASPVRVVSTQSSTTASAPGVSRSSASRSRN